MEDTQALLLPDQTGKQFASYLSQKEIPTDNLADSCTDLAFTHFRGSS